MPIIELKYGSERIGLDLDPGRFDLLAPPAAAQPLTDAEIGERLDKPIDSPLLDEIAGTGESVLIVVPDATRRTASPQIVNLLVRRLIAGGTAPHEMAIIFATGIHRGVTAEEKDLLLTPFIAQRIKTLDHDPRDLMQLVDLGHTESGIPVMLNRAVAEFDHAVIVGGINFHYFAGFTGGRKLICPGLASSRTTAATHKLAFDCERKTRREGVDTGLLDANAVHEAFMEAVAKRPPSFAISTIVNETGEAVEVICGDWQTSHRSACESYASSNTVSISEKRELVIASCGGYPYDINMIQVHKTLDAAARACVPGGTIVLLAECRDGLGRSDFLDWFKAANSGDLATRLCEKYQVNGQTAWSLLQKAEHHRVQIVTSLPEEVTRKLRLEKIDPSRLSELGRRSGQGYIVPSGAGLHVVPDKKSEGLSTLAS